MDNYLTKETLEQRTLEAMTKVGVNDEVKELFINKLKDSQYSNMLSTKGIFFVLNFLSEKNDKKEFTTFYSNFIEIKSPEQLKSLRNKLDKQGFLFFLDMFGWDTGYGHNLFILEPREEFNDKLAFYGGLEKYLEGL